MISRIIFGCHNLTGGSSFIRSRALVHAALDLGIRRFDVAPSYGLGTAESTLGRLLDKCSEKTSIELTTKFGVAPPRHGSLLAWAREPYRLIKNITPAPTLPRHGASTPSTPTPVSAAEVCSSIYQSCRRLRVDCIDAVLIHERVHSPQKVGATLEALKRHGTVRRLGLSGHVSNVADMLSAIPTPAILQVSALHEPPRAPAQSELRIFNILSMLAANLSTPIKELREREVAQRLARISAEFLRDRPDASLIYNTSSVRRLVLFARELSAFPH